MSHDERGKESRHGLKQVNREGRTGAECATEVTSLLGRGSLANATGSRLGGVCACEQLQGALDAVEDGGHQTRAQRHGQGLLGALYGVTDAQAARVFVALRFVGRGKAECGVCEACKTELEA